MEKGSSKSLFTLLGVVVFGIFISLSYFLFQDQLQSIVATTTSKTEEHANTRLDVLFDQDAPVTVLELVKFNPNGDPFRTSDATTTGYTYAVTSKLTSGIGYYIQAKNLLPSNYYVLTFDITKESGNIYKLGGHATISNSVTVLMDGVVKNNYTSGFTYPNDYKAHHIEVRFDTLKLTGAKKVANDLVDGIHIQVNRDRYSITPIEYEVSISNVKLVRQ
jgi:hypothetical protein